MTTIWRLETEAGRGVYVAGIPAKMPGHLNCDGMEQDNRPMPYNDQKLTRSDRGHVEWNDGNNAGSWKFGFASLRQYRAWFNSRAIREWFTSYEAEKIILAKYRVNIAGISFGDCQVRFNQDKAELVACFRPNYT